MAEKRKNMKKLSEAVLLKTGTTLPEAIPDEPEINTVAAVSEPFADARIRNKAARERFKKMIDDQTKQARETLGLDKHLPERQANGNGKLVEDVDDVDEVEETFIDLKWYIQDTTNEWLEKNLRDIDAFDGAGYAAATSVIAQDFETTFKKAADAYKAASKRSFTESKKTTTQAKITLDESLFEAVAAPVDVNGLKTKLTEKLSKEQAATLEKVLRGSRDNLDRYLWQLDADVAQDISQLSDQDREKLLTEVEGTIKAFYDKSLKESRKTIKAAGTKKLTEATVIMDARDYKPWSGAVDTYNTLDDAGKLDYFFDLLEDIYPDGIDVTALNDLLWFERDWVYDLVGINNPDETEEPEEEDSEEEEGSDEE